MRTLFVLIAFQLFSGVYNLAGARTIKINGKSCNYNIIVPEGWDTIPADTLKSRFGKGLFDVGLYNTNSKSYFDGDYIQYIFLPTIKPLSQFTFAQITKDVQNGINIADKLPKKGEPRLITDNFNADKQNRLFYIAGKITSGTKERKYAQIIVPTKFGFLKIMYYAAKGAVANSITNDKLLATVNIPDNYRYTEPPSKFNLNIWHLLIAFAIGLAVYFSIQYAPKIKQLLTKKESI